MSGKMLINNSLQSVPAGAAPPAVQAENAGISYGTLIIIAAALTLIFGAAFIFCLRRYMENMRQAAKAEAIKRRQKRMEAQDSMTEDRLWGEDSQGGFPQQPEYQATQAVLQEHGETPAAAEKPEEAKINNNREKTRGQKGNVNAGYPRTEKNIPARKGIYVGKVHNIGRRSSQQDSFGISADGQGLKTDGKGIFAIVADGMGGLANGGEISAIVTMSMMESFDRNPPGIPGDRELLEMLGRANDNVNNLLNSRRSEKSGSTVVAVLVRDSGLYWLTVGDSHLYLYRDGALMQMNRDHVYSVDLDEMAARGEISVGEAQNDPQRKALTSYIGMGKIAKIDRNVRPLKLRSGDRVALMSDGVFGTLNDEEIIAAMKLPIEECGEGLSQMIQSKNKAAQDNYTALILEYMA